MQLHGAGRDKQRLEAELRRQEDHLEVVQRQHRDLSKEMHAQIASLDREKTANDELRREKSRLQVRVTELSGAVDRAQDDG